MQSQKLEDFQQSLGSVLNHYGMEFLESTDVATKHNYGEGLLDLLKLVDFKKRIDEKIAVKRKESFNWQVGIKSTIDEYYNLLGESRFTNEGYEAAQNGNNIIIEYVLDRDSRRHGHMPNNYFPLYNYFLGAEIAYILPRLEWELKYLKEGYEFWETFKNGNEVDEWEKKTRNFRQAIDTCTGRYYTNTAENRAKEAIEKEKQELIYQQTGLKVLVNKYKAFNPNSSFFEILNAFDYKAATDDKINNLKKSSVSWKKTLEVTIADYKYELGKRHLDTGYEYNAVEKGYLAVLRCKDSDILINWTVNEGRRVSDFYPIYDYVLGAEIAYILPRLESELKAIDMQEVSSLTMKQNEILPTTLSQQPQVDKIIWLANDSDLAYFLRELKAAGFIQSDALHKVATEHFVKPDGKPISKNMKQLISGVNNNKSNKPKKGNIIDSIINNGK